MYIGKVLVLAAFFKNLKYLRSNFFCVFIRFREFKKKNWISCSLVYFISGFRFQPLVSPINKTWWKSFKILFPLGSGHYCFWARPVKIRIGDNRAFKTYVEKNTLLGLKFSCFLFFWSVSSVFEELRVLSFYFF